MNIEIEVFENLIILTPKLEHLDAGVVVPFKKKVEKVLKDSEKKQIILNLVHIRFMDSSGFGSLIGLQKICKSQEHKLGLCSLSAQIDSMFHMLNLDKHFEVFSANEVKDLTHTLSKEERS